MYSELRSLSNKFIILTVISIICSCISLLVLRGYWFLKDDDEGILFFSCIYLSIAVPVIFVSLAIALRKIANILSIRDKNIGERFRNLEEK